MRYFALFIICFLFLNITKAQPPDGNDEFLEMTYPVVIKKKLYPDTLPVNYEVYGYYLGKERINYSLDANPELFQTGQTDQLLSFRFDVHANFSNNLPVNLFIVNDKKDTMQIFMTSTDFQENKGFIDTIFFVNGKFKLAEIEEIRANKEKLFLEIKNQAILDEYIPYHGWWGYNPATEIKFIEKNRLVYFPEKNIMLNALGFERRNKTTILDTLGYRISNDSIYLFSSFTKNFLSQQEVWIKLHHEFGCADGGSYYIYGWKGGAARRQLQKRIKRENDTLELTVNTEPLLYVNSVNHKLSVYINDSMVFSDNTSADSHFLFIGNYIRSYSDSVIVKVKYDYSYTGQDEISKENTFVLHGYGTMRLNTGIGYENEFAKAPFEFILIRGQRLYYDGSPFLLKHGVLPDKSYFTL